MLWPVPRQCLQRLFNFFDVNQDGVIHPEERLPQGWQTVLNRHGTTQRLWAAGIRKLAAARSWHEDGASFNESSGQRQHWIVFPHCFSSRHSACYTGKERVGEGWLRKATPAKMEVGQQALWHINFEMLSSFLCALLEFAGMGRQHDAPGRVLRASQWSVHPEDAAFSADCALLVGQMLKLYVGFKVGSELCDGFDMSMWLFVVCMHLTWSNVPQVRRDWQGW